MGMPAYEVSVCHSFRASHAVAAPDGSMESPHEHDWQLEAVFRAATLDDNGFVVDFLAIRERLEAVAAALAGQMLNLVVPNQGRGASAERVAQYVAERLGDPKRDTPRLGTPMLLGRLYAVRVIEAPGCRGAYYPESP